MGRLLRAHASAGAQTLIFKSCGASDGGDKAHCVQSTGFWGREASTVLSASPSDTCRQFRGRRARRGWRHIWSLTMSRTSKMASSAPYLEVCRPHHGRLQVKLLASHSEVYLQCYLRHSLTKYNRQLLFLTPALLKNRISVNFVFRCARLRKGEEVRRFVT